MFAFLKDHPFAVEAFFESSVVLAFAAPKEQLLPLIPKCLSSDLLNNEWGFVAAAFVQTKDLRPKGFPKFMGRDFMLAGFRVFVRYTTSKGKNLRGLYILKSETNRKFMEVAGNIFTHYHYTTSDIHQTVTDNHINIRSEQSGLSINADIDDATKLPDGSPFKDWQQARRFAGPLPFTFTYNENKKEVLIIEGVRENWYPLPLRVKDYNIPFIKQLGIADLVLANAFIIQDIPYYWKKGKKDKWQP